MVLYTYMKSIVSEEETPYIKIRENGEKVYLSRSEPGSGYAFQKRWPSLESYK